MRPTKTKIDYEKVKIGEMLTGIIEECQYEENHTFKGFGDKPDQKATAIRLKLKLDGYQWPHYSNWMRLTLGEKSNLYKKYASKLIENATPDMDIDLDILEGMKIKVVFSEDNNFQNIDSIFPAGKKAVNSEPEEDNSHLLEDQSEQEEEEGQF